jgi:hypothetical protein
MEVIIYKIKLVYDPMSCHKPQMYERGRPGDETGKVVLQAGERHKGFACMLTCFGL